MKKHHIVLLTVPAVAALLAINPPNARAQMTQTPPPGGPVYYESSTDETGFHLGADAGASIMQDFSSSRMGFPGRFSTRPGARLDIAPEYDFPSAGRLNLAVDAEAGGIYNRLDHINDAGVYTHARGDYFQVPFVADLLLKFHPCSFVTPYIGGGGGGDYSHLRINRSDFFGSSSTDDEVDPAVQAMGGVLFRLTPVCQLGLGYKWLAAFPSHNQDTFTHAVLATFNFRF